jgi:acetate kinase
MSDAILVLNAGSSSLKFSLFEGMSERDPRDLSATASSMTSGHRVHFVGRDNAKKFLADRYLTEGTTHEDVLATSWAGGGPIPHHDLVAGHRAVHGGSLFTAPI